MPGADPSLTANIYCAGGLDRMVIQVVAPFWRELQGRAPDSYLWLVRDGAGGEHLKVRIHGPESELKFQRHLLEERATAFFAGLSEREPLERQDGSGISPLDVEDERDHPDRTLLWTTWRRSHISLGGGPFLDDDRLPGPCDAVSVDPAYRLDPFAPDPAFSPLFKAFHGLGNQLGLAMADEVLRPSPVAPGHRRPMTTNVLEEEEGVVSARRGNSSASQTVLPRT